MIEPQIGVVVEERKEGRRRSSKRRRESKAGSEDSLQSGEPLAELRDGGVQSGGSEDAGRRRYI